MILKFGGREEQCVGVRGYGQVDCGGDAVRAEFVGFADINQKVRVGGVFDDVEDL